MKCCERILTLRIEYNMTQAELAQKMNIPNKQLISNWERGRNSPSVKQVMDLARIFGVTVEYIIGIEDRDYVDVSQLTPQGKQVVKEVVAKLKSIEGRKVKQRQDKLQDKSEAL